MKPILAIARREVQANFLSPIAYAFMGTFLIVTGIGFVFGLMRYSLLSPAAALARNATIRTFLVTGPFGIVSWAQIAMLVALPGLSMRLFSEERKTGTIELLFTSPLTTLDLVVGKYLGALVTYALMIVLTAPYAGILIWKGKPELAALAMAYVGMFLCGATILAIGLAASSLTENQFVALVITFAIVVPLYIVQRVIGFAGPTLDRVIADLSIGVGLHVWARGSVDSHYLVLYAALIFVFLFLCSRVLESRRWG